MKKLYFCNKKLFCAFFKKTDHCGGGWRDLKPFYDMKEQLRFNKFEFHLKNNPVFKGLIRKAFVQFLFGCEWLDVIVSICLCERQSIHNPSLRSSEKFTFFKAFAVSQKMKCKKKIILYQTKVLQKTKAVHWCCTILILPSVLVKYMTCQKCNNLYLSIRQIIVA